MRPLLLYESIVFLKMFCKNIYLLQSEILMRFAQKPFLLRQSRPSGLADYGGQVDTPLIPSELRSNLYRGKGER